MLLTTVILLNVYFIAIVLVLVWPARRPDPQRGQAIGCLMIVAVGIALLGGILALAAKFNWPGVVQLIFWIVVFPAILLAGNGVWYLVNKVRSR